MATGRGYASTCLGIVQSSYRTPIEITDGLEDSNLITFEDEGITQQFIDLVSEWRDGSPARKGSRQGPKSVSGPIRCKMTYDEEEGTNQGIGVGLLLALATQCGVTSSTHGDDTYAATGYNRYTPANDPARFITLAFDHSVSKITAVGCKIPSWRIIGNQAGDVVAEFDVRCYDLQAYTGWTGGTEGKDHAFAALRADMTTDPTMMAWQDLTAQIADRSNVINDGSDKQGIGSFTFAVDNGLSDDEYSTDENSGHTDATKPLEHEGGGNRSVTLDITVPRYSADTYASWHSNHTALQAEFEFYYSATRSFWIRIPKMVIPTFTANVTGPGMMAQSVSFVCERPNASDTMHLRTHKFEDGSAELKDENSQYVEYGIETLDDRRNDPFSLTS